SLGIVLKDLDRATRSKYSIPGSVSGVVVDGLVPGSPAAQFGFNSGDVIAQVNKSPVKNRKELIEVLERAHSKKERVLLLTVKASGWTTLIVVDFSALR